MKLRKLLYSIKMYKFYRIKVNSKKVVIASVSEAIQYLLDCFVAAFYFHFSRTALEIILLAMTISSGTGKSRLSLLTLSLLPPCVRSLRPLRFTQGPHNDFYLHVVPEC